MAISASQLDLDRLLRLPGIRFAREPDMGWSDLLMGYELRNALVTCDPAARAQQGQG